MLTANTIFWEGKTKKPKGEVKLSHNETGSIHSMILPSKFMHVYQYSLIREIKDTVWKYLFFLFLHYIILLSYIILHTLHYICVIGLSLRLLPEIITQSLFCM